MDGEDLNVIAAIVTSLEFHHNSNTRASNKNSNIGQLAENRGQIKREWLLLDLIRKFNILESKLLSKCSTEILPLFKSCS